jgi:hypothetical protein
MRHRPGNYTAKLKHPYISDKRTIFARDIDLTDVHNAMRSVQSRTSSTSQSISMPRHDKNPLWIMAIALGASAVSRRL